MKVYKYIVLLLTCFLLGSANLYAQSSGGGMFGDDDQNNPNTGTSTGGTFGDSDQTNPNTEGGSDGFSDSDMGGIPLGDAPNITFADPAVKAICVGATTNWDTNHDGELSEAEAAAVTNLGEVFRSNTTITSFNELQYFTSLTTIGNNAFDGCTGLTSIAIPPSLNRVKTEAFKNCTSLSKVIVTDIAAWCGIIYEELDAWAPLGSFPLGYAQHLYSDENTEITELVIPDGVTRIEPLAFRDAKYVTSVTIPNSVTYIGAQAFRGMHRLTSITIPQNVSTIEPFTFNDCQGLTSVTIPEGVISLENNAFRGCPSLTSVALPQSLKHIEGHAFINCINLTSITIPDGITHLSEIAFEDCPSLTSFTYNKAENALTKVNGVYQIGTAEDLLNFAILSTAANTDICAQLTADIDYTGYTFYNSSISENLKFIGLNNYCGTFDGNGHTITVDINNQDSWRATALFRVLGKGGVIKNLRVAGRVESVSKFSAGIVSDLKSGKVSHCVSDVDIVSNITGDCTDGGIAGIATYDGQESIVEYCVVAGSFQGSNAHHRGGIIGIGYGGNSDNITIDNCLFLANVDGLDVTESGTFIRQPTDKTTINNCYYLNVLGTVTSGTQTTTAQMTSGELCFLLNGNQSNINWTQNLTGTDADTYPLPFSTHAQVYAYGNTYSNNDLSPIITFADANVKALCVANWDTNHDGELSEAEAAAVTNLGTVFKEDTTITSFNELQYFTGLTGISERAFNKCTNLAAVTLPSTITSIGTCAFDDCYALAAIDIPSCVTFIDGAAFSDCRSLTSIVLPEGITSIGEWFFDGCIGLTEITIPESVTSIGSWAFWNCSGLTSVTIGSGVTSINYAAFFGCSGLTSVSIPNSVTSIGAHAFDDCTNLTAVTMPASVITFDDVEGYAFGLSNNIESVYISDLTAWLNTSFPMANNPLRCGAKLYLNNVEVKDLVIPEGTTAILTAAFEGCGSLTSIAIPNNVTTIGDKAFDNCTNLVSVYMPDNIITFAGDFAFGESNNIESVYITSLATWLETSFDRGNNPLRSGAKLYLNNEEVTDLVIPEGTTAILVAAFEGCESLTSVTIPSSVTYIGVHAFQNCYELVSANIPDGITSINEYTFCGCGKLESIIIPNSVTSIGDYAFSDCSSLTSVTIGNSVTSIGEFAFLDCSGLTDVWCYAENVPNTYSSAFNSSPIASTTLHVPAASLEAYSTTAPWSGFGTIVPIEEAGIEVTDISQLDNAIYIEPFSACMGIDKNIEVRLKNAEASTGYGFDLVLPEGISIAVDDEGSFNGAVTLSPRNSGATIATHKNSDNQYTIAVMSSTSVTGNDGLVLTVKTHVQDEMPAGTYPIAVKNSKITFSNLTQLSVPDTQTSVTVRDYLIGDVNGDGETDLLDAVIVLYHSVGKPVPVFIEAAGDVNNDNEADLLDAVMILYYSVGKIPSLDGFGTKGLDPQ